MNEVDWDRWRPAVPLVYHADGPDDVEQQYHKPKNDSFAGCYRRQRDHTEHAAIPYVIHLPLFPFPSSQKGAYDR